jgi:hypothetical protein
VKVRAVFFDKKSERLAVEPTAVVRPNRHENQETTENKGSAVAATKRERKREREPPRRSSSSPCDGRGVLPTDPAAVAAEAGREESAVAVRAPFPRGRRPISDCHGSPSFCGGE